MNPIVRLHRDDPSRRDTFESARSPAADSIESVLAGNHIWLRFPPLLEARFKAETLESRRRLLVSCSLLGCVGVVLGSLNVNELTPEIGPLVWQIVWVWMAAALTGLLATWFSPASLRRSWHAECTTATLATAMCLLVIWMTTASRADTAFTHSAGAAVPVMYACIAARLRFYWSLGMALTSFTAYVAFVHGHTPEQVQLTTSHTHLMALSYAFALVTNYAFEHRDRRTWLLRQIEAQHRDTLMQTSAQLHLLSIQDPLTGLFNRRQFDAALRQAMATARAKGHPLSLMAIDVDFFKAYNDTHGHPAGDACLTEVARILATVAKAHGGMAARLGGEEFALLLPDHAPDMARQAADAVCRGIAAARMSHGRSSVASHVTVSVGLAHWLADQAETAQSLQERADKALYRAKAEGRNRVRVAGAREDEAGQPLKMAPAPAASGLPDAEEPLDPNTRRVEALCHQTLEGRFRWLRFPAELEGEYTQQQAGPRRKFLTLVSLLGLTIYNAFVIGNRTWFPDIQELLMDVQVRVSVFVLFTTLAGHMSPWPKLREAVYSLSTAVVALASTWMLAQSQLTSTLSYAVCLMLIPMFSGVVARQPFWFTCIPTVITSLAAGLMFTPAGPVQHLVYQDSLFMILNTMAYTLILAYTLDHGSRKQWLLAKIDGIQREALVAASQRLKALSVVDPLTQICNRRQFEDDLDRIWHESLVDQRPLGMVMIDVDHFKLYNDKLGHPAGDECLKQVAAIISQTAQLDKGLAARMGGEEFGVLLPGGTLADAMRMAERIRSAVSQAAIPHDYAPSRHVTVSVGVASITPQVGMDRVSLFATADKALYEAKRLGRNRVMGPHGQHAAHATNHARDAAGPVHEDAQTG